MCPPKKNAAGSPLFPLHSSRAMLQLVDVMERLRQLLSFVEIFYKSGCDLDRKCLKCLTWGWNGMEMERDSHG